MWCILVECGSGKIVFYTGPKLDRELYLETLGLKSPWLASKVPIHFAANPTSYREQTPQVVFDH